MDRIFDLGGVLVNSMKTQRGASIIEYAFSLAALSLVCAPSIFSLSASIAFSFDSARIGFEQTETNLGKSEEIGVLAASPNILMPPGAANFSQGPTDSVSFENKLSSGIGGGGEYSSRGGGTSTGVLGDVEWFAAEESEEVNLEGIRSSEGHLDGLHGNELIQEGSLIFETQ